MYLNVLIHSPSFPQFLDNENSKHQKPNIKQIPITQIQNIKQIFRLHLCKWHNYRQSKFFEKMRTNCGECFGHWKLQFETYLLFGAYDLGFYRFIKPS